MPLRAETDKLTLIDTVAALAAAAPGDQPDERFIRDFYRNVPPDDILRRRPADLLAAAATLWHFVAERRPGRAKLRVLNPHEPENAWTGGRTIVQICNDDMPFLVDSVTAALNRLDLVVNLVIHPVVALERDTLGRLEGMGKDRPGALRESVMHIELAGPVDAERRDAVVQELDTVLADVRAAVVDWRSMRKKVDQIAGDLGAAAVPVPASEASEASEFLNWLVDDNFTFLGYREYEFGGQGLTVVPGVGRGLLRNDNYLVFDGIRNFTTLSPDVQSFLRSPQLMLISKSNRKSTVHRPAPLDTIGIKTFDTAGQVTGQKLIVGLFTSGSYSHPPHSIPMLRRKVQSCLEHSGFEPTSHDRKALQHILDSYPRDELFQIEERELFATALGILHLQERQRIALFARKDPFERFISALVYVPRDRYTAEVSRRMAAILERAFNGAIASQATHLDESVLARIHFIVATTPGQIPEIELAAVEQALVEAGRVWADRLGEALAAAKGEESGVDILRRFGEALPNGYVERFSAATAVADIDRIIAVETGAAIALTLYHANGIGDLRLKTFHAETPIALSDVLPMLENLGLKVINEIPFEVRPRGTDRAAWIQEFQLVVRKDAAIDLAKVTPLFEEAFPSIWSGALESDGFNRLILGAALSAREVVVLRSYCKLLRQAGSAFSQAYMEDTVGAHPYRPG